jgi:hypothetical protein
MHENRAARTHRLFHGLRAKRRNGQHRWRAAALGSIPEYYFYATFPASCLKRRRWRARAGSRRAARVSPPS